MSEESKETPANGEGLKELRALILELKDRGVNVSEGLVEKNRELVGKLKEARRHAAAPGDVILTGDDAKAWNAYRDLGDPKDLRKALEAGKEARAELGSRLRTETNQQAARLANLRPSVLDKYVKADGIEVVIEPGREKDKDGNPIPVALVKGEGDTRTPLIDYATKHWPDAMDLLKEPVSRPGTPPSGPRPAMPAPTGGEITLIDQLRSSGYYGPAG